MIPLRDTIPSRNAPWTVRLLMAANIAAFAYQLAHWRHVDLIIYRFGVVPSSWALDSVRDILDLPRLLLTLVTSQFLHGDLLHLGSNMLYLWIFGDNVEDRFGSLRFLLLYLGSGVAAALVQLLMGPQSWLPMIGASGAISGVLGAYVVCFPTGRVVTLMPWFVWTTVEIPAFAFLGVWFLLQWTQGMATLGQVANAGGVAWWAHIGGFVVGMIAALRMRPRRRTF